MKKLAFPRICLPVIAVGNAVLNFCLSFGLFFLALILLGRFRLDLVFYIIPLIIVQTFFAVSFGIGLGVLNVFFRDTGRFFNVILQFWFWFTPIVYPVSIVPKQLLDLVEFNPMYHIISGYQSVFVYNTAPTYEGVGYVIGASLVLFVLSFVFYKRNVGEMVDEL